MKNILKKIDFDLLMWLITIIELLLCVCILLSYNGIYKIEIFAIIIIVLPIVYIYSNKGNHIKKKIIKIIILVIVIILPLIIVFTLPQYTYNNGQNKIKKEIGNITFIKLKNKEKSIYFDNNTNRLFIRNRVYFYKTKEEGNFIVNPINGDIKKIT